MGVITLKIDDKLESQLRRKAGKVYGASKGAISRSVEQAIASWLSAPVQRPPARTFSAFRNGQKVAEENDLRLLADDLRARGIDPRTAEIRATPSPPSPARLGLRTKPSQE